MLLFVCRQRTKDINTTDISRDIYEAERLQDKANDDLETANEDADMSKKHIGQVSISTGLSLSLSSCSGH